MPSTAKHQLQCVSLMFGALEESGTTTITQMIGSQDMLNGLPNGASSGRIVNTSEALLQALRRGAISTEVQEPDQVRIDQLLGIPLPLVGHDVHILHRYRTTGDRR